MNQNNDRYNNSGPISAQKKGIPLTRIIFIVILCIALILGYKIYSKVSGFLTFVSGEIDAVSSSIQHFGFSTSGPIPLDENNENGMIIEDNSSATMDNEEDGEEATRIELPAPSEERKMPKNEAGNSFEYANSAVSNSDGKKDTDSENHENTEKETNEATDTVSDNQNTENDVPPAPFPRKLNPFEDSLMGMDTSNGGHYKSEIISDGYFKGFTMLTLQNSLGITQFIQKDGEIYQYAFFPPAETYSEAGTESQRGGIANETFRVLYDKVYGDGAYSKNKSQIYKKQLEFASVCGIHKAQQWHFVSIDGYSYGCNKYGFTVLPDQAADRQGIITVPAKSAAISRRRAKFMDNLRKAQQAQKAGIMPKSEE